jgi:glycoprotein 6-alpha-L-fucosyltransferase
VHVRRSDKLIKEANEYPFDAYMKHVNDYYNLLELMEPFKLSKRIVYLATDEPSILNETLKYPSYEFIYSPRSIHTSKLKLRYSKDSFEDLITDVHLMTKCNFFVGTFSSQLGRLVYELMQFKHPDASWRFRY